MTTVPATSVSHRPIYWVVSSLVTHRSLHLHPIHNMADMERVQSWNRKLKLQCLKCEMSLFGYQAGISDFTVTRTKVSKGIVKLFHSKCPSPNPGRLLFCIGCGAMSVDFPGRIWKRHCTCKKEASEHTHTL